MFIFKIVKSRKKNWFNLNQMLLKMTKGRTASIVWNTLNVLFELFRIVNLIVYIIKYLNNFIYFVYYLKRQQTLIREIGRCHLSKRAKNKLMMRPKMWILILLEIINDI